MLHKVRQESGRPQGLPENYYPQGWRIFKATRHGPCSKRLPLTLQRKNEARKRGRNKSMGFNQFSDEYAFLPASGVDIKVPGQQERKTSREVTNTPKDNSGRGCPCVLGAGRRGNLRLSERRSKLVWFLPSVSRLCKFSSAINEKTAFGRLSRNVVGGAILLPNRGRCFARLLAHHAWCSATSASRKPLRICSNSKFLLLSC